MWLKLENQHYEHLKGKEAIKGSDEWEKTLAQWRESAFPYPQVGLKGAGVALEEEETSAEIGEDEAMSILGLSPGSMRNSTREEALALLGVSPQTQKSRKKKQSYSVPQQDSI